MVPFYEGIIFQGFSGRASILNGAPRKLVYFRISEKNRKLYRTKDTNFVARYKDYWLTAEHAEDVRL